MISHCGEEGSLAICCNNGPEFLRDIFLASALDRQTKLVHIEPGKPQQSGHAESFNGRLREECLNVDWFVAHVV